MDFLGIGFAEILLIVILIFLVFEVDKMPQIAETLGKLVRQIKQASTQFFTELIKETKRIEEEVKKNDHE